MYRPVQRGVGCLCGTPGCGCGVGDAQSPAWYENLWSGLQSTVQVGSVGIPLWTLALAGLTAAYFLMPEASTYRKYRRR